jgi:tRNA(His) 5'-end guanylyltransferase
MMNLGDRIKRYEKAFHHTALRRTPVMIRVDGRAFHTFTKHLEKPFDGKLIGAMCNAATEVAKEMQGFKAAYVQSDEATFCITDYDDIETQGWFDYDLSKMVSLSAALMSVHFLKNFETERTPVFDSRAFNVPPTDVVNAFLWRALDWERNSIQMYSRAFFSHKELMHKRRPDMHEMLHGVGKNWATDISDQERNGTFLISTEEGIKTRTDIRPTYEAINAEIGGMFVPKL